jgi:hypothetical protein
MRLSAFLEAWVQLVLQEGNRVVPKANSARIRVRIPQQGVTELIKHHKVAAAPSQPQRGGPIEAVNGRGIAKPVSGTGGKPLLAHEGPTFERFLT